MSEEKHSDKEEQPLEKGTAAYALNEISNAFARELKENPSANAAVAENIMLKAVEANLTGNPDVDDLIYGYARDTLLLYRTRQQKGDGRGR